MISYDLFLFYRLGLTSLTNAHFGFLVEANVNRKPLINMQKEFNKKYYKRFN